MAKKTLIIDDLTGESGARTRRFSLDGAHYEIDLTDASFADLRAALKPFMRAGRTAGVVKASGRAGAGSGSASTQTAAGAGDGAASGAATRGATRTGTTAAGTKAPRSKRAGAKAAGAKAARGPRTPRAPQHAGEHTIIRTWARANGVKVTMRGRVNASARQAWEAAGSPGAVIVTTIASAAAVTSTPTPSVAPASSAPASSASTATDAESSSRADFLAAPASA